MIDITNKRFTFVVLIDTPIEISECLTIFKEYYNAISNKKKSFIVGFIRVTKHFFHHEDTF